MIYQNRIMVCRHRVVGVLAIVATMWVGMGRWTLAGDALTSPKSQQDLQREHWENVVLFYGDEETGEWSLRIEDRSVSARAWFEWKELWQFDPKEQAWISQKTTKFQKPIVLPKQKGADEPEKSQVLVKFEEIPPQTAGLWYATWRIDGIDGGTLMRVGTNRTQNKVQVEAPPPGMVKMAVPVTLEKSIGMIIPDPRIYCVSGGPGKPVAKGTKAKKADPQN